MTAKLAALALLCGSAAPALCSPEVARSYAKQAEINARWEATADSIAADGGKPFTFCAESGVCAAGLVGPVKDGHRIMIFRSSGGPLPKPVRLLCMETEDGNERMCGDVDTGAVVKTIMQDGAWVEVK